MKLIDELTMDDVIAAKERRGAISTVDYVLAQVNGTTKTLEQAKEHLKKIKAEIKV